MVAVACSFLASKSSTDVNSERFEEMEQGSLLISATVSFMLVGETGGCPRDGNTRLLFDQVLELLNHVADRSV